MGTDILNKLVNILVIVVGAYFLIYHRKLGKETAESLRNKILPLKKAAQENIQSSIYYSESFFGLVGILALFGVIRIKGPF